MASTQTPEGDYPKGEAMVHKVFRILLVLVVMAALLASPLMTHPVAASAPQSAPVYHQEGNLDLQKICTDQGLKLELLGTTAYSWKCVNSFGTPFDMDLDGACRAEYSEDFHAVYRNMSDPYSWLCVPEKSPAFQ